MKDQSSASLAYVNSRPRQVESWASWDRRWRWYRRQWQGEHKCRCRSCQQPLACWRIAEVRQALARCSREDWTRWQTNSRSISSSFLFAEAQKFGWIRGESTAWWRTSIFWLRFQTCQKTTEKSLANKSFHKEPMLTLVNRAPSSAGTFHKSTPMPYWRSLTKTPVSPKRPSWSALGSCSLGLREGKEHAPKRGRSNLV